MLASVTGSCTCGTGAFGSFLEPKIQTSLRFRGTEVLAEGCSGGCIDEFGGLWTWGNNANQQLEESRIPYFGRSTRWITKETRTSVAFGRTCGFSLAQADRLSKTRLFREDKVKSSPNVSDHLRATAYRSQLRDSSKELLGETGRQYSATCRQQFGRLLHSIAGQHKVPEYRRLKQELLSQSTSLNSSFA